MLKKFQIKLSDVDIQLLDEIVEKHNKKPGKYGLKWNKSNAIRVAIFQLWKKTIKPKKGSKE